MFHQNDFDLMRQRYHEYNRELNKLVAPVECKPGLLSRVLAALRGATSRTPKARPQVRVAHGSSLVF